MLPPDITGTELTSDEVMRYARHLSLPELGVEGQRRLKAASVLCVGAGGLGSPLLLYLAAAGVGRIGLVDHDVVDISNLQRQVIHGSGSLGRSKTESASARIRDLNPHCLVERHPGPLNRHNALEILRRYDLVCDGSDNFPTRYLVNDASVIVGIPDVYGSVFRFEGQVSVFNHAGGPNYRDLCPEPPPAGLVPSCVEGGVMGVLPGLIGVLQATEAIKLITGIGTPLSGRLLVVDALTMRFRELRLNPLTGREPIEDLIDYEVFCRPGDDGAGGAAAGSVSPSELQDFLEREMDRLLLMDVRTPAEARQAVIPGAVLVPLADIETGEALSEVRRLASGRRLVVHCQKGQRSLRALSLLRRHGIEGLNLDGGIEAWQRHHRGQPTAGAAAAGSDPSPRGSHG
jgi:adenylyltransferase/sulfurtransferase